MSLTAAVWPQFAMQVFGGAVSTAVWEEWWVVAGPNWYRMVVVWQPRLLL